VDRLLGEIAGELLEGKGSGSPHQAVDREGPARRIDEGDRGVAPGEEALQRRDEMGRRDDGPAAAVEAGGVVDQAVLEGHGPLKLPAPDRDAISRPHVVCLRRATHAVSSNATPLHPSTMTALEGSSVAPSTRGVWRYFSNQEFSHWRTDQRWVQAPRSSPYASWKACSNEA